MASERKAKRIPGSALFDAPDDKAQVWLFLGKSRLGKSHLIRWLILDRFKHANWKFGLTFVGTKFTGDYAWLPPKFVIAGYSEDKLKAYMTILQKRKERGEDLPPNFVYFDDLVGVLTSETPYFQSFCTTCRHTNTNVIVAVQYMPKGISTTFREQVCFAVMFGTKKRRTLKSLYSEFGQLFPTEDEFTKYLWEVTAEPYTAVLYTEYTEELGDNYIPIRAPKNLPQGRLKFA